MVEKVARNASSLSLSPFFGAHTKHLLYIKFIKGWAQSTNVLNPCMNRDGLKELLEDIGEHFLKPGEENRDTETRVSAESKTIYGSRAGK